MLGSYLPPPFLDHFTGATGWIFGPPPSGDTTGATDVAAIQNAIYFAHTVGGANGESFYILLWRGIYYFNAELFLPTRRVLKGVGRNGTIIRAASGFSTSTNLARIGDNPATDKTICFWSRFEDLTFDLNYLAKGVFTDKANEQSGLERVQILNPLTYGFYSSNLDAPGGAQNYHLEDVEVEAGTSTPATAILVSVDGTSMGNPMEFRRLTLTGAGVSNLTTLMNINAAGFTIDGLHVESCTDGILLGDQHQCAGSWINNVQAGPNVTNAVHVAVPADASTTQHYKLGVIRSAGTGATNYLLDDQEGITINHSFSQYDPGGGGVETVSSVVTNIEESNTRWRVPDEILLIPSSGSIIRANYGQVVPTHYDIPSGQTLTLESGAYFAIV